MGVDLVQELPYFIIKRLPLRFTFDNNYFNDRYQGIPIGGYTKIVEEMLVGIDVCTNTDFFNMKVKLKNLAGNMHGILPNETEVKFNKIVYTGQIDQYFDFCYGPLEYRSACFETEQFPLENYQGNAVVNYTDTEVPWTRIIEHKHFEFGNQPSIIISREYSSEWQPGSELYYPENDYTNEALYVKYKDLVEKEDRVIFGGRLGQYKYYDMDKTIRAALDCVRDKL